MRCVALCHDTSQCNSGRVVKNPGFLVFCPWVVGFCQNPRVFAQKPRAFEGFWWVFIFLPYLTNTGLQSEFIQAITESNYSLKTRKQLSATYKPYLEHIGHTNIGMQCT